MKEFWEELWLSIYSMNFATLIIYNLVRLMLEHSNLFQTFGGNVMPESLGGFYLTLLFVIMLCYVIAFFYFLFTNMLFIFVPIIPFIFCMTRIGSIMYSIHSLTGEIRFW